MWQRHRHFYRLQRKWNHPDGYLFYCQRCKNEGLYAHVFIRYNKFWGAQSV